MKTPELLLEDLDEAQREAVLYNESNLLVIAGAGSGKTRVVTYKIAYLLSKGVKPQNILAVTFTNKAAREMLERVQNLIGDIKNLLISTFHSACARWLRIYGKYVGIPPDFTIYDDQDSTDLLKEILSDTNLDTKAAGTLKNLISKAKAMLLKPSQVEPVEGPVGERFPALYAEYQRRLQKNKALDFDDLLFAFWHLLKQDVAVRERFHQKFQHILVDEYQDTNFAQKEILKLLRGKNTLICAVGDEDQSIYGFRGARVENILEFEKEFAPVKKIYLTKNYRSTPNIVETAHLLISHNRKRHPKKLVAVKKKGEEPMLVGHPYDYMEAYWLADELARLHYQGGYNWSDMAVFFRINALSRYLEEALIRTGIPYAIFGGLGFYQRKEVKDVLAYLKFFYNPSDAVSFKRIVNLPARGIGPKSQEEILKIAESKKNIAEAFLEWAAKRGKGLPLAKKFAEITAQASKSSPAALIETVLRDFGYEEYLRKDPKAEERLENVAELLTVAAQHETLEDFLGHVSLFTDMDLGEKKDAVNLMTAHLAKGLEFPVVFVVALEEGIFPHYKSKTENEIEEERRLAYVAFTRAKEKLYLSWSQQRILFGRTIYCQPSRFLEEARLI